MLAVFFSSFHLSEFIDPTGTYTLKGNVERNIIKGLNGQIKAKLFTENKLALSYHVDSGFPDYKKAVFTDTIFYDGNEARYHSVKDDDCTIVFKFSKDAVNILLIHTDPGCTCGYEKGLIVPVSFEKNSSDVPFIR